MHEVTLHEHDSLTTLAEMACTGIPVTLVREDHPIAQIVPIGKPKTRASRMAALARLKVMMQKGYDLGLMWNGRDELYDRADE